MIVQLSFPVHFLSLYNYIEGEKVDGKKVVKAGPMWKCGPGPHVAPCGNVVQGPMWPHVEMWSRATSNGVFIDAL